MTRFSILMILIFALVLGASAQTQVSVTIANGASLSSKATLPYGCMPSAIVVPATWTPANLTFQVATTSTATTGDNLFDEFGAEVTVTVPSSASAKMLRLTPSDWYWVRWLYIRSGTSGTPVNQGGARTLTVVCR